MSEWKIRTADPDRDAEALVEIYRPYVEKTAITFEYVTPSVEEFRTRMRHTLVKYPYLVIEKSLSAARHINILWRHPFI